MRMSCEIYDDRCGEKVLFVLFFFSPMFVNVVEMREEKKLVAKKARLTNILCIYLRSRHVHMLWVDWNGNS